MDEVGERPNITEYPNMGRMIPAEILSDLPVITIRNGYTDYLDQVLDSELAVKSGDCMKKVARNWFKE